MERRLTSLIPLAAAAIFAACAGDAQAQTTQQGRTESIVLQQFSFIRVDDLHFGEIIPGATAGVVRIEPNGTRTATGGVTLVGSSHQVARFVGLGTFNQQVQIRVNPSSIQLTGPGAPMTLSQFELGLTPTVIMTNAPIHFRIADASGLFDLPLGARLAVGANQVAGTYSGTFSIILNYQ